MSDHYDVIIIGTGAGGGRLLHKLAPSGKPILVLERGLFGLQKYSRDARVTVPHYSNT